MCCFEVEAPKSAQNDTQISAEEAEYRRLREKSDQMTDLREELGFGVCVYEVACVDEIRDRMEKIMAEADISHCEGKPWKKKFQTCMEDAWKRDVEISKLIDFYRFSNKCVVEVVVCTDKSKKRREKEAAIDNDPSVKPIRDQAEDKLVEIDQKWYETLYLGAEEAGKELEACRKKPEYIAAKEASSKSCKEHYSSKKVALECERKLLAEYNIHGECIDRVYDEYKTE